LKSAKHTDKIHGIS